MTKKKPTKSRRLTARARLETLNAVTRVYDQLFSAPMKEEITGADAGAFYEVVMGPYKGALAVLPSEMLTYESTLYIRSCYGVSAGVSVTFDTPRPWFVRGVDDGRDELVPGIRTAFRNPRWVEIVSDPSGDFRHPVFAKIDALCSQKNKRSAQRTRFVNAVQHLLNACSTSGQLLSVMPGLRDYLPEELRQDTPTNRGVAAIRAKFSGERPYPTLTLDETVGVLAQIWIHGGHLS
jgi:hypothetical protein